MIVSGDRHLLDLGEFRGIPVMTVATFLKRFQGSREIILVDGVLRLLEKRREKVFFWLR